MMEGSVAAVALFLFCVVLSPAHAMMPGGISDNEKAMTPELRTTLAPLQPALKERVSAMTNGAVGQLEPVAFKTQVVSGTNYFVKYRIGNSDQYIHARIYRPFKGNPTLVAVSGIKSASDPIEYFPK